MWYLIVSIPDLCNLTYFGLACHGSSKVVAVVVLDGVSDVVFEVDGIGANKLAWSKCVLARVADVSDLLESLFVTVFDLADCEGCELVLVR